VYKINDLEKNIEKQEIRGESILTGSTPVRSTPKKMPEILENC
jgi:hypothetical protein